MKPARLLPVVCLILCAAMCAFSGATNRAGAKHPPKSHVSARQAQFFGETGPRIWLGERQRLAVAHVAGRPSAQYAAMFLAQGVPLSLAHGDFDADGVEDLVAGYATLAGGAVVLHRGNLDAFAPQSQASFEAIRRGEFPAPFLPNAQVFDVPVEPDFLAAGDFTGNGMLDLAVAARGGNFLYILPGDGKGHFGAFQAVMLPGRITALAAGTLGMQQRRTNLLVGVSNGSSSLMVLGETGVGLEVLSIHPVRGPVSNILFGNFGDAGQDAAFLSGGNIEILRSNRQVEDVSLPVSVRAFALGSFIFDRNGGSQIAVLGTDGSIHFAVRNEFDSRMYTNEEFRAIRQARRNGEPLPEFVPVTSFPANGWRLVESFPGVGSAGPGQTPVVMRTRISVHAADDVMVLNPASGQMVVISHASAQAGAQTFVPGEVSRRPYSGTPIAALSLRTNADVRPGVIALHRGEVAPSLIHAIPDPTFTVNTTNDGVFPGACAANTANECTVREAILEANGDTIMVPAGTYTLTIAKVANDCTGKFGALSAEHTVTIVGAGQNTTIIQAGTVAYNQGTANGVDMVMNVNEDLGTTSCPITSASASLSNLTLQNGHNRGTHGNDGDGGCMEFDTGTNGTANLALTNVTLQNCNTTQGSGGGLANFNFEVATGTGQATISNSIIQGNSVTDTSTPGPNTAGGGGIWVSDPSRITMTSSQVLNNLATQTSGGSGPGGGIFLVSKGTPGETPETQIHSSTIFGNQSSLQGGGINDSGANLLVDSSTVISGNKNGPNGGGGGLFVNPVTGNSVTLTKVTITNNTSTGTGGGIATGAGGAGAVTMSFSRLAGNTAGTTGSELENLGSTDTVTDNWWGTNSASSVIHTTAGTTSFDPFIVLSNTASPNLLKVGQTSTVAASFLQDDKGNAISASNLNVLIGLPTTGSIFSNTPADGTLSNVQTTIQSNGEATETYTAVSGGIDTVDATIDNATVPATITVLFPPTISKAFSVTHIPVFTSSPVTATLTFTITNPNTANALHGLAFTDNLPSGLQVADTTTTNTCGGTLSGATSGSTSVSLSGGTVTFNAGGTATCTVAVDVKGVSDGLQNNTSGNVTATDAGGLTGNFATRSITVINPPSIAKSFAPTSIPFGATSALTLTLSNSNANSSLNGIAFTDTFPTGLVVATPSNLNSTCSGTTAGGGGSTSITLSGATLSPGASCTVTASVTGSVGTFSNSVNATSTDVGGLTSPVSTASLTVTKANTNTTVTSSVNPSVFGQSVTFTATVSAVAPGVGTPTGNVVFNDGGSPIGTGTLSGGIATFATSALAVGNHTITTSYAGDTDFNGSTGSLTGNPQVVNKANTAIAVTSSVNPSVFGQSVTFAATVAAVAPGSGLPTGTVEFLDNGNPISACGGVGGESLLAGATTCTTSGLTVGNHTITTSYSGDGNFNTSGGNLNTNPQVVNKADTATTVTSSQNPQTAGQPVTFTATVSAVPPGAGTPTGSVEFLDNGNPVSDCGGTSGEPVSGPSATCTTSALTPGNHTITTLYSGDGGFNGSTGSLTGNPEVITQAATTTTVNSSAGTITLGDTVTFTATVTAASGTATGSVTFFDGNTPLGSSTLTIVAGNDQAAFSTSLLSAAGSPHSITAVYHGATSFAPSTSSPVSETVNERGGTTGVVMNPTGVVVGQSSTATITVTDSGSVPPGTADTFSPTGAPATGRTGFTGTFFADGLVLVAGGTDAHNNILSSAEIYSVSGGTFSATGSLATTRTGAVAVLLPTGKVLIAGGSSDGTRNGALNSAELFDPNTGTFTASSSTMTAARFGASITLLNTGKVLIAGGINSGGVLNTAELYDPVAGTFTATGNLNTARTGQSATLLGTGKVLVAGGSSDGTANGAVNSGELFDPAGNSGAGTFTSVAGANPTLATGRWEPEAVLLSSGKVLVAGGQNSGGALTSADLYDPVADSFTPSNQNMSQARANGSALALPSGMVLLVGGTTNQAVDLYDPKSDRFDATGSLQQSDVGTVSTLLDNGDVLVVGLTTAATPASDAELYSPSFNPLGTVGLSSSEATDAFGSTCILAPSISTASTCASTITPFNVATSPHIITGTYPADAVHSGSNNTANLTVSKDDTTTTITANTPDPSQVNQAVTVTVQVAANAPGSGTPTGSVTVSDGAGQTCTISALDSTGSGSCSLTPIAAGTDTLTATYSGDANYNGSTSNGVSQSLGAPPSIAEVFSPTAISLNSTSTLTFTITNPAANSVAQTGVAFADTLPAGLVVSAPSGLADSCGGAAAAPAGTTSITLTGGSIAVHSSCTVVVNVTGTAAGIFTNVTGAVSSTNGGAGNTATASLTVTAAPSISDAVNPTAIPLGGVSTLTFTIVNPGANTAAATGVTFSDTLPSGLVVAAPNGLTNSCAGTAAATAGGTSISLTGGSIAVNSSCSLAVNVTGTAAGTLTITSGVVSSTNGGTGNPATTNLTVVAPPQIATTFTPPNVGPNGTSTLSFTVTNPAANTTALAGVSFTDTLPAGIVVTNPNGLTGSCGGGTITATSGSGTISLTGGTIPTSSSCTFSLNVTGATAGQFVNTTSAVTSTNGGTGSTASATLTIATPPSLMEAFGASSIGLGASTSITFTITNANQGLALTGVAFSDTLPAGLAVSTPTGLAGSCGGATITAAAGSQTISVAGGTVNASSSCSFALNVTAVAAGIQVDTSGTVSATDGGTGNSATASINVLPPDLTIAITNTGKFFQGETGAAYTVTVKNVGTGPTAGTVTIVEAPPSGISITAISGTGWSCVVGTLSCKRTDALAAGASYSSITITGNVASNAPASVTDTVTVSGGGELNTANDSASDTTTITLPPDFSLSLSTSSVSVTAGGRATYMLTVTPENNLFAAPIALTASGLPVGTSITFQPSAVTPGANPATSTLVITTTPGDPFVAGNVNPSRGIFASLLLPLFGLVFVGAGLGRKGARQQTKRWVLLILLASVAGFALNGCAMQSNFQKLGTPTGSYTFTITGTSGATQHSIPATLVVKP